MVTRRNGDREVHVDLVGAALFMSPAEATELVTVLTGALAEIAATELAGAR